MYVHVDVERQENLIALTLHCYRLRELFPCYVRANFAFMRVLTFTTSSLNNRDNIRALPSNTSPSSAFQLESVRPNSKPHQPKADPNAVTVTVHRTTTGDFAMSESSCDNEQGLNKSVRILHIVVSSVIEIVIFLKEGIVLSSLHHESPPPSPLVSSV
jgi:hypothetical protein